LRTSITLLESSVMLPEPPIMLLENIYNAGVTHGYRNLFIVPSGNTKGGSITVPLTSCLTGLELVVGQLTIFVFICKTDQSKGVKQEVNGTMILSPLVFPGTVYLPICCIYTIA
jgi:hypothetical protein